MEYIINHMETVRLMHFKTIVDAGGLMKASELLGITGGGLSKSIKSLEDELGEKLFFQKGRGLKLTEYGHEFYKKIPLVLEALDDLINTKKITQNLKQKAIRFVSFEVFTTYFLANFINQYIPHEKVEIREAIPGEMEKFIFEEKSDIGITYNPIPYRGVEFLKVGHIVMGAFTSKPSKWKDIDSSLIPFVAPMIPIEGSPSGVKGLDGWPEHLFERYIKYNVDMMESAIQLAASGMAVAFLPQFIVNYFNEQVKITQRLQEIKIADISQVKRDIYIIIRKNNNESSITKKLAKAIRQIS